MLEYPNLPSYKTLVPFGTDYWAIMVLNIKLNKTSPYHAYRKDPNSCTQDLRVSIPFFSSFPLVSP